MSYERGERMAEWLNREQAAARLGVSTRTISNYASEMIAAGAPGVVRRGHNFLRVELNQMMQFLGKGKRI